LTARQSMRLPHPNYRRFHAEPTVCVTRETRLAVNFSGLSPPGEDG